MVLLSGRPARVVANDKPCSCRNGSQADDPARVCHGLGPGPATIGGGVQHRARRTPGHAQEMPNKSRSAGQGTDDRRHELVNLASHRGEHLFLTSERVDDIDLSRLKRRLQATSGRCLLGNPTDPHPRI